MRMILGIALAIMSVCSAFAQIVDMKTVTCNDFTGLKRDHLWHRHVA